MGATEENMMTQRAEAFIVDALRTPTGRRRGSLAQVHGADLGATGSPRTATSGSGLAPCRSDGT